MSSTPKTEDPGHQATIGNLRALRYPFPTHLIGKLPATRAGRPELDYVGHGAVTDRLLEVDPFWTWEPMALNEDGLPRIVWLDDDTGVLWIKLTVLGVTRLGVGTAQGDDVEKKLISDALRNAAMRFGVALDLWIKGDPSETEAPATPQPRRPRSKPVQLSDATMTAKADLLRTVNGSKTLARELWGAAASNYGFGVDDDIPDDQMAADILAEAKRLLLESGKVRKEVFPPPESPFDGSTEPFDMPDDLQLEQP